MEIVVEPTFPSLGLKVEEGTPWEGAKKSIGDVVPQCVTNFKSRFLNQRICGDGLNNVVKWSCYYTTTILVKDIKNPSTSFENLFKQVLFFTLRQIYIKRQKLVVLEFRELWNDKKPYATAVFTVLIVFYESQSKLCQKTLTSVVCRL